MTEVPIQTMGGSDRGKENLTARTSRKAMPVVGIVHRALRSATLSDHASIDRMLLRFNLNRPQDYAVFLQIHCSALLAVQAEWRREDDLDFGQLLTCVQADLKALGCAAPMPPIRSGTATRPSNEGLGVAYVVRGSRLGGAVLRRTIVSDLPTAYLDFMPALSWRAFLIELESIADEPNGSNEAAQAARRVFGLFASEFVRLQAVVSPQPP